MSVAASSSTVSTLTEIWKRVLRRSEISVDGNFFDLGGTAQSARLLFKEIVQELGTEHPVATICYAPTIATLAKVLDQIPREPLAPLVKLHGATAGQPIFLAQGIGSSVEDFMPLARHLGLEGPFYCMQTRGLDGIETPFDRIEDMAEYFLEAIQQIQPHGQYFLVGYSFGGLIVLEIARRLRQQGQGIGSLIMIDTYPHKRFLPFTQRAGIEFRRARHKVLWFLRQFRRTSSGGLPVERTLKAAAEQVRQKCYTALRHYRPQFFEGRIDFVKAAVPTDFPDDPAAFWRHFAAQVNVATVSGKHLEIITSNVRELAAAVRGRLSESVSRTEIGNS